MRKSKIFSDGELAELKRRENKDYKDKYGIFSSRTKPKIIELLEVWLPKKKQLEKIIKSKKLHD